MLGPKFGSFYPELKPGRWLLAWQAAVKRAEHLWRDVGAEALILDRVLPDGHFHFRGGTPRDLGWGASPERLSAPTPAEVGNAGW